MKQFLMILFGLTLIPLPAADQAAFTHWPSAELKAHADRLAAKASPTWKGAAEVISKVGNHNVWMVHRFATGDAEWHEMQADLFVIQTGEATVVVGGELVNERSTNPVEKAAPSTRGGQAKKVAAGDIVYIPAKTAHHVQVEAGKQVNYFILKIPTT